MSYAADFEKALQVGRPPNIRKLFPNSKALIVSGKVIDRAMIAKGKAITMAANGRNYFVIKGVLLSLTLAANASSVSRGERNQANLPGFAAGRIEGSRGGRERIRSPRIPRRAVDR